MPGNKRRAPRRRLDPKAFEPKKLPSQARSIATYDAIVGAGARILASRGYRSLTTNHVAEAAGVGIASLYEYFPGKDAVVAAVAERLVERVIRQLTSSFPAILALPEATRTRALIGLVHETMRRERALVAIFVVEVPYTRELPAVRALTPRLHAVSRALGVDAGISFASETVTVHLLNNLIASTMLQLVLDPPDDVSVDEMLDGLSHQIERWIRAG